MNRFFHLIILFITSCFSVFGQQQPSYKWYTSDNGELPQNSVKSIVPDQQGFIWLATEDGLVRFDGQQFKVYNSENIKGMKSNRMKFIKKRFDQPGNYVANDLGQILKIEQNPKLYYKNGSDIHPLNETGRLFGNHVRISPAFFKYYRHYDILIKDKVFRFYPDSINYYAVKTGRTISSYPHKLALDSEFFILNNRLFLKVKKAYFEVTPKKLIPVPLNTPPEESGTIYINNAIDQAFLYSGKKLYFLSIGKAGLDKKEVLTGLDLEKHKVQAIYYDARLDLLYIGSLTKGFIVIRPEYFKTYTDGKDPVVYSNVLFDSTSVLTGYGEIIDYKGAIRHTRQPLLTNKFYSIMDHNGDLWTLDIRDLYRYKKQTGYTTYDKWSLTYFMSAVYKDERGLIWIGTTDSKSYKKGKLYVIDPNVAQPRLQYISSLNFSPCSLYKEANASRMLIGSPSGLYHLDLDSKYITKNSVIAESFIRGIHSSDSKNIWVYSYNNGLFLIRDRKGTTHFPFDKNKYIRSAHCVVEDQKGFIWIPTNKGLFQASRQNLMDYADKKHHTVYYHYYDKSSGFSTNEFNGGCFPCATNLPNGYIALPSFEGLTFFDSKKIKPILPTNPIYINEAKVDDQPVFFNDTLVLNRNFNRVVINISSPFYGNPENLSIDVRLNGTDNQYWSKTTEDYTISYTTLSPGEYKLTARKLNGFNSEYDYKTITIIVPPAFWQTLWFKVLLFLLGILLLYYGFRQRTKYIRHRNLLLERKISHRTAELKTTIHTLTKTQADLSEQIHSHKKLIGSITHDIKSPLKYMALTGKYLYENLNRDNPDYQENIKTMYSSSFELYHFVNNLLEYSKIYLHKDKLQNEIFSLHDLIREKIKLFDPIAKSKHTVVENSIPGELYLNLNKQLFTIIIHNLLDNAVKNTDNGTIRFSAVQENNRISITLTDTGIGMGPEMLEHYQQLARKIKSGSIQKQFTKGIGFHIIIELLHLIHGDISIESILHSGTTITLYLEQQA